jgi:DNA-binding NtrC family response regulator
VDDLPSDLQRRLHRRLQYLPEDVRVIATAAPDGRRLVAEGTLRPELYYMLAVVVVAVPPLRQRTEDILPLFQQALETFAERYSRSVPTASSTTLAELERHAWPGNIRELLNLAERMAVMGAGHADFLVIEGSGAGLPNLEPGFNLATHLEALECKILVAALRKCNGDRAETGRLLGVERNTLRYKLNKYGLLDK